MGAVLQVLITAVALWVSTALPGIDITTESLAGRIGTLVLVALLFGLINAVIKPVVKLLGCVAYVATLGLIGLVVNALLFWLTGWIAASVGIPFQVSGFWAGFFGAIVVALVGWLLSLLLDRRESDDDNELYR